MNTFSERIVMGPIDIDPPLTGQEISAILGKLCVDPTDNRPDAEVATASVLRNPSILEPLKLRCDLS